MKLFKNKKVEDGPKTVPLVRHQGNTHGSHWETFLPDLEKVRPFLQSTFNPSNTFQNLTRTAKVPYLDIGDHHVSGYKGDLHERASSILLMAKVKASYEVASAYPVLWSRNSVEFRSGTIYEWSIQIEAYINGKLGDASLTFFPVDFFFKRDDYINDMVDEISLGFFAYEQYMDPFKDATVDAGEKAVRMDQAEIIFPLWKDERAPDDYRITGKVQRVEILDIWGERALITTISLFPIKTLEIFCLEKNMDRVPKVGEMIGAAGWLQGRATQDVWTRS